MIDYKTDKPDIPRNSGNPLTAANIGLFQHYKLQDDVNYLEDLIEKEFHRHLRLCEMEILKMANLDCYWAQLPKHPLVDVNIYVDRELEANGFKIEHKHFARELDLPVQYNDDKKVRVVESEFQTFVNWLNIEYTPEQLLEIKRRRQIEEDIVNSFTPVMMSVIDKSSGKLIDNRMEVLYYNYIFDEKYVVEIQKPTPRDYCLCIFEITGKYLYHQKIGHPETSEFGDWRGDIAYWENIVKNFVANKKNN